MSIDEIRKVKDKFIRIRNDKKQIELYDMGVNSLRDKIGKLNAAKREGKK